MLLLLVLVAAHMLERGRNVATTHGIKELTCAAPYTKYVRMPKIAATQVSTTQDEHVY